LVTKLICISKHKTSSIF